MLCWCVCVYVLFVMSGYGVCCFDVFVVICLLVYVMLSYLLCGVRIWVVFGMIVSW